MVENTGPKLTAVDAIVHHTGLLAADARDKVDRTHAAARELCDSNPSLVTRSIAVLAASRSRSWTWITAAQVAPPREDTARRYWSSRVSITQ
jgi:hypothetical protein